MKYSYLGKSGLKVSQLCLGTMNFGPETEEKEAFRIMDAALDAGINFFDTANVYGGQDRRGWTEEIIGRWFQQGGGRREKVVLATKVYNDMFDEQDGPNSGSGLSAYKIRRHFEGSLRRLQTDHIELYQMHHIDRNVSWDELWGAFEILVSQGKADYIGSSNFAGWHIAAAQAKAKERHFLGLVSEQHLYNLLERTPEPGSAACLTGAGPGCHSVESAGRRPAGTQCAREDRGAQRPFGQAGAAPQPAGAVLRALQGAGRA